MDVLDRITIKYSKLQAPWLLITQSKISLQNIFSSQSISRYLWRKVVCLFCFGLFCLYSWDPPNQDPSDHILSLSRKLLKKMQSNQGYYTRSQQNSEVKCLWVTSWEVPMLHPLWSWKALEEKGCISFVPWCFGLVLQSSWILNYFFIEKLN